MDEIDDLDDSIVEDIIKVLEQKKTNRKKGNSNSLLAVQAKSSSSGRFLDESMDISNLNVSFNSVARTSRPSTAKQLAAKDGKVGHQESSRAKASGPAAPPAPAKPESGHTPRSSMLYQESDNYEDEKFDSESDKSDAESIAEEISSEEK